MGWKLQSEPPQVVMFLASLAVTALVMVTWAMIRVSSWIVGRDEVWAKMDDEGKRTEHFLAEAFHALGGFLVGGEVVCVVVLLWVLWRAIRPKGPPCE